MTRAWRYLLVDLVVLLAALLVIEAAVWYPLHTWERQAYLAECNKATAISDCRANWDDLYP